MPTIGNDGPPPGARSAFRGAILDPRLYRKPATMSTPQRGGNTQTPSGNNSNTIGGGEPQPVGPVLGGGEPQPVAPISPGPSIDLRPPPQLGGGTPQPIGPQKIVPDEGFHNLLFQGPQDFQALLSQLFSQPGFLQQIFGGLAQSNPTISAR